MDGSGELPARPEGEAWGLLIKVNLIYLPFIFLYLQQPFLKCYPLISLFILQGLNLLKQASSLCKEAWQLEREAQHLETEGLEKLEVAVAGSEVEGFYGLLKGAMSHSSMSSAPPPHKKVCHTPFATISHPPPQESQEPKVLGPAEQAPESTSSTATSVLEGEIPANMQPLHIQLGGIKHVYQCQVEGCREGPSTSHATICVHMQRVHLGVGLVWPLYNKSFFNPDTLRCHKKGHLNV